MWYSGGAGLGIHISQLATQSWGWTTDTVTTILFFTFSIVLRLPKWLSGKESTCQCRRCKRHRFNPWVRKILWREWLSTPVFLPTEFQGQRSLAVIKSIQYTGLQRDRHDWERYKLYLRTTHIFRVWNPSWKKAEIEHTKDGENLPFPNYKTCTSTGSKGFSRLQPPASPFITTITSPAELQRKRYKSHSSGRLLR